MWFYCGRRPCLLVAIWTAVSNLCCHASAVDRYAVTPVQKVAELLGKLRDQVEDEGKEEAISYDKYACFCKDEADNKAYAISRSDTKIAELQAAVDALGSSVTELDDRVVSVTADVSNEETAASAANEVRAAGKSAHQVTRANLTEAVSAIERAIDALRSSKGSVASLKSASALLTQLRDSAASRATSTPGEAPVYEYKSGTVLATLQDLLITFKAELAKCEENEATTQHDHDMVEGARAMRVKFMQEEITQKETLSAKKTEEKHLKQQILDEETAARNADQAFLDELTENCKAKATAWEERSKTRADEVKALTDAIEELGGVEQLYTTNKKLVGLVEGSAARSQRRNVTVAPLAISKRIAIAAAATHRQRKLRKHGLHQHHHHRAGIRRHRHGGRLRLRGNALVQTAQAHDLHRIDRLQRDLRRQSQNLKSPVLAQLAEYLGVGKFADDHFAEVRDLIKDLISKLEQDSVDEATAKSNCDDQIKAAVATRDEKAHEIEGLESSASATSAAITALETDISSLSEEIAGLHKALNEITELRAADSAENNKTSIEAAAGAAAVREAISILEKFYGTALLQNTSKPGADRYGNTFNDTAPETFEGEYARKLQESKGIFGLLEIIASDFERTASVTAAAEEQAEVDFNMQSSLMDGQISQKGTLKDSKTNDKVVKSSELVEIEDDLNTANTLHAEALETLESLKAACVNTGESWEERKAQREKEIEALKEALSILEAWQG